MDFAATQAIAVTVEDMRGALVFALGVLLAPAGLLFTLQGFGAVSRQPDEQHHHLVHLGPIIALIGIAIAVAGWRGRKS